MTFVQYDIRKGNTFHLPPYRSTRHGINSLFFRDSLLWNNLPSPLSTNPTKWSNILKQFVGNLPTNCLSKFDHFVKLALKWLEKLRKVSPQKTLRND